MPGPRDPLIGLLQSPAGLAALPLEGWYPTLTLARRSGLIGALAARAQADGVIARLPEPAQDALIAGRRIGDHHDGMLRWEARRVRRALYDCGHQAILLKGAAYAMLDLPSSRGRLTGDIDILVRRSALDAVEAVLEKHGWVATEADAYNQRYYREHMHELPPLRHRVRETVVDVHHTISPPTSRIKIDGQLLWEQARPVGDSGFWTLGPADMVLHAIIHLFHEGSIERGLRDMVDIDGLLRHFGQEAGFWEELTARADRFGAGRVLFYGLRYAQQLFATPVPPATVGAVDRWRPAPPVLALMDWLVLQAIGAYRQQGDFGSWAAAWLLYVRSHWRRMPPLLLAAHLLRKTIIRRTQRSEPADV
jgi:hypothetical protein